MSASPSPSPLQHFKHQAHDVHAFDDSELTSLAMEILHDLNKKPPIDPQNDSFIYKLASEIQEEIMADGCGVDTSTSSASCNESRLYLSLSDPSSQQTVITHTDIDIDIDIDDNKEDDEAIKQDTPMIVSSEHISNNDSFGDIPPLPLTGLGLDSTSSQDDDQDRMTLVSASSSSSRTLTFGVKDDISVSVAITNCISPRNKTPIQRQCAIPDYCRVRRDKLRSRSCSRRTTCLVRNRFTTSVTKVMSPIVIDSHGKAMTSTSNTVSPYAAIVDNKTVVTNVPSQSQSRSRSRSRKRLPHPASRVMSAQLPTSIRCKSNRRTALKIARSSRTKSMGSTKHKHKHKQIAEQDEYAIEVDDGFIFISTKKK